MGWSKEASSETETMRWKCEDSEQEMPSMLGADELEKQTKD